MARADWLRTFLAVYRSGSVTAGAQHRGLTQPAASQHLAALEGSLGGPLFVRTPGGMEPTQQGRELYARVAEPLDGLETVLRDLGAGALRLPEPPVRLGSSPEFFSAVVLGRLVGLDVAVTATFGRDADLFAQLERGDLDIVVTTSTPPRRSIAATTVGHNRFVLVAASGAAPSSPLSSLKQVGTWLRGRSWVSYSLELPRTRRFWQSALGQPFSGRLRLVAPDLRTVLKAVELGLGVSLLPEFVCAESLAHGHVVELFAVSHLTSEEPWFACTRSSEVGRSDVLTLLKALHAAGGRRRTAD